MAQVHGQGYIAQALGMADVLSVVYLHSMRHRPTEPEWEGRDRLLLSVGHYGIVHNFGAGRGRLAAAAELEGTTASDQLRG